MAAEIEKGSILDQLNYWKNRCLSVETKVDNISASVSQMTEVPCNCGHQSQSQSHSTLLQSCKEDIQLVKKGMQNLEVKVLDYFHVVSEENAVQKQYSMKNNAILHGYKFLPSNLSNWEFIDLTVKELNSLFPSFRGNIQHSHIDAAHPLAPKQHGTSKMVIVRFANRWLKSEIIRRYEGKVLPNGIRVTEHLSPYTRALKAAAVKLVGIENVKTEETVVYAYFGGHRYSIKYSKDLDMLKELICKPNTSLPNTDSAQTNPYNATINEIDTSNVQSLSSPLTNANTEPLGKRSSMSSNAPKDTDNVVNKSITDYQRNYPDLYQSLFFRSKPSNKTTARGRPSRNGRGGKRGSHFYN